MSTETLMANWISGSRSAQVAAVFRCERIRSSRVKVLCCTSIDWGCAGVVRICLMSAALQSVDTTPRNSDPLSESINSGTPCTANHVSPRV